MLHHVDHLTTLVPWPIQTNYIVVTKKEDPENPQQWRDLPRTLALTIYQSTAIAQTRSLSWLGLPSCHRSLIHLQLQDWQTQQCIHSTQCTALVTHCTQMFLRKNAWMSFMDCIYSPRAQTLPSNTISYENRRHWLSL
jgi:hypothetical protein